MAYTVTRQLQWPEGKKVVEISFGTYDYVNPDALVSKYPHEGSTFEDPLEAIEAGISICRLWRKAGSKDAKIGIGNTLGFTIPFEVNTFREALTLGKKLHESYLKEKQEEKEIADQESFDQEAYANLLHESYQSD